jgi:hypothetical protein
MPSQHVQGQLHLLCRSCALSRKMFISLVFIASTLACLYIKTYMNIVNFTLYAIHRYAYACLYIVALCVNGRSTNLQEEAAVGYVEVNYTIICWEVVMKTSR